jgi:hypothetical protein
MDTDVLDKHATTFFVAEEVPEEGSNTFHRNTGISVAWG